MFDRRNLYLALSLLAPIYYGFITLNYIFSYDFIVQDDMRQHVVWFQQFVDPEVFKNNPIAQYFRSVAPIGVTTVYWFGAQVGIDPLLLAKLLPLPLALIATGLMFYTTLEILPVPLAAWLATLIFNQHLWLNDDLVSATPRAFVYPLFAAFLYYTIRRSLVPILLTIALLGLFFPQMMLVALAMLIVRLMERTAGKFRLTRDRRSWQIAILATMVAATAVLPFAVNVSDYGAAITADQMQSQPEYQLNGRNEYFGVNPIDFALNGSSGIRIPVFPSIILAGFALPFLSRWRLPIVCSIKPDVRILIDLMAASVSLFFLAHWLLLRLHFPSRYTYHSWRFALSIAAGIVLAALISKGLDWWREKLRSHQGWSRRERITVRLSGLMAAVVILVPLAPPLMVSFQEWKIGDMPEIYRYLATQPPDTQVASLSLEANNIPAFSHRSTWVGREFALPHHPQYYQMIRDRTSQLLQAQYSSDISDIQKLVDRTEIDFFLIERSAFNPNYLQQDWLFHSMLRGQVKATMTQIENGLQPAIATQLFSCVAISTERYVLVKAECL